MNYLPLIISAILTIISGLLSFLDKRSDNKQKGKKSTRAIILFIGVLIGAVTTCYFGIESAIKKQISDNKVIKAQIDLQKKSDIIIEVQKQHRIETKRLTDSLNTAKNDIISIEKETLYNLTGGDSYCYMWILDKQGDYAKIGFSVEGKYPLEIQSVRIVNRLDTTMANIIYGTQPYQEIVRSCYQFPAKLYPKQAWVSFSKTNVVYLDKNTGVELNVFFSTNRGFITQEITMKYSNGWKTHTVISDDTKIISNKKDKGFPN